MNGRPVITEQEVLTYLTDLIALEAQFRFLALQCALAGQPVPNADKYAPVRRMMNWRWN